MMIEQSVLHKFIMIRTKSNFAGAECFFVEPESPTVNLPAWYFRFSQTESFLIIAVV